MDIKTEIKDLAFMSKRQEDQYKNSYNFRREYDFTDSIINRLDALLAANLVSAPITSLDDDEFEDFTDETEELEETNETEEL